MVTGLAHESGNALARSQACLEMLALEVEDRPEALDLIGRIQKAQDHLQQLYEEVRNYAAPLKLERQRHSVSLASGGKPGRTWPIAGRDATPTLREAMRRRRSALSGRSVSPGAGLSQHPGELAGRLRGSGARSSCPAPQPSWTASRPLRIAVRDNGPGLTAGAAAAHLRAVLHDQDQGHRPGHGDC